jgi:hypothetical protein
MLSQVFNRLGIGSHKSKTRNRNPAARRRALFVQPLEARHLLASIAVFDNPSYVDTLGAAFSESDTIQASLVSLGHTVTTFTGLTAADFTAALAGKDVLVIPEQEIGAIAPALSAAAKTAIQNFVAGGGGLVISCDYRDFLNGVFGYSLVDGGSSTASITPAATGTAFAGGPATLPPHSFTLEFDTASLPSGAQTIYSDGVGSTVTLIPYGSGTIASLGWDWFNAAPLGSQDSGWLQVLDSAVEQVGVGPTAPSNLTITGGSVNENGTFNLVGSFSDPNAGDTHTVTVSWGLGEGTTTVTLPVGARSFSIPHPYQDDNPTATAFDVYDIHVTVSDGGGGGGAPITGPDGFGYQASTHPFEPIDLIAGQPGVTVLLDGVDDASAAINLGANTFNFYGVTYTGTSLFANSNGLFTGGTSDSSYSNTDLTSFPNQRSIAPLWDDWVTYQDASDQVLAKVEAGRLIVEWSNVRGYSSSPSAVTFQAILELNTGSSPGDIIFNYVDLNSGDFRTNGANATVGIKDVGPQGPNRLLVSYNSTSPYVGDGKAILIGTGTVSADTTVTVNNVAPTINSAVLSASSINEGDSVTVTGTFSDPALGVSTETFTGTATWSDGVSTPVSIVGGTFSTTRTFPDDNPTATAADTYTVSISIQDDDGGVGIWGGTQSDIFSTQALGTRLGTIDRVTGAGSDVGPFGTSETWAAAFDTDGTLFTLFNGFSNNARLGIVNQATGAVTPVGSGVGTSMITLEVAAD